MPDKKVYRKSIARILAKDDRLHPNKRMMAFLILLALDDTEWALDLLKEQYGNNPKRVYWSDSEDNGHLNTVSQAAKDDLKALFAEIEGKSLGGENDTTSKSEGS